MKSGILGTPRPPVFRPVLPPKRQWWRMKRFLIPLGVFVVAGVYGAIGGPLL